MNIQDVLVFTTAVAAGSLSEAARRLGMPSMTATRRLAALEATVGVRLMHRTTRSLSLTAEGETFLPYAQALVENTEEALAQFNSGTQKASGLLRVSVPVAFGIQFVAPLVPQLLEAHPSLRISLDLNDALPDLVSSGMDLAIRIARLKDSNLIARKLADNPRVLVASPEYLRKYGTPRTLEELQQHDCLPIANIQQWNFVADGHERHMRLNPRFSATSIEGCHAVSIAGGGIALLANWNVEKDLQSGRLVEVKLEDAAPQTIAIWAVYPTRKLLPAKVSVFISALQEVLDKSTSGNG
ncbi:LysR family transcriptional regulator [Rhizobium sp. CG4]|uniref:LysR family transcriptional regulator n=1 Tax=Rhizobium sp. CG4 TaxID=2726075 RepID=UPI00203335C7|nr:LysR family transcriptional regulator [Rhizobium sp. CG4]MCM2455636.1 LysR family transcriptional regulator [Rhizobium sp. CG4]